MRQRMVWRSEGRRPRPGRSAVGDGESPFSGREEAGKGGAGRLRQKGEGCGKQVSSQTSRVTESVCLEVPGCCRAAGFLLVTWRHAGGRGPRPPGGQAPPHLRGCSAGPGGFADHGLAAGSGGEAQEGAPHPRSARVTRESPLAFLRSLEEGERKGEGAGKGALDRAREVPRRFGL